MSKWDENRESGGNALLKIAMHRVPKPYGVVEKTKNRLTSPHSKLASRVLEPYNLGFPQNQIGPYCECRQSRPGNGTGHALCS